MKKVKILWTVRNSDDAEKTCKYKMYWRYKTMYNDKKHEAFVARQFMSYYEKNHLDPEEKAMIGLDIELLM